MKAVRTRQSRYDNSTLEETEFALAVSPCPRLESAQDIREVAELERQRSGVDRRRQVQSRRQDEFPENDLTETLTVGWALALAIAVALTVFVSGG